MKTIISVLNKKKQDIRSPIIKTLEQLAVEDASFVLASPSEIVETEDLRSLLKKTIISYTGIGLVFTKHLTQSKLQFTSVDNTTSVFEGRLYESSDALTANVQSKQIHVPNEKAMEKLLRQAEGDFCQITVEPQRIMAARDAIGVQPLYYGENETLVALATNRRALWKLNINKVYSFPPGNLASISKDGFIFKPIRMLVRPKPKRITLNVAAERLRILLERSVCARVKDTREVAVAFSGGLDSSIIAFLAKKSGVNVHLIHVSLYNQPETEEAKKIADMLELPLDVHLFKAHDVETAVIRVLELIEEADPIKVAIAVPFLWIANKTVDKGISVLLAGQGADELFGGYQRYLNEYILHGKRNVQETMFSDVMKIHESNLERDEKICRFYDVELRLPFASYDIAKFALNLPVELKLEKKVDGLRKLVLRETAMNLGLPKLVVNKPKKAIQYATGVNTVLTKTAKRQSLNVKPYVEKLFHELND
ncbi:MAG TPA: asparagine synthetase B [Candidatus Sulfotelmatobacter sp.]|nr:asparagine synthetase B [Candidatus Sulfotelmatobacter sp.]